MIITKFSPLKFSPLKFTAEFNSTTKAVELKYTFLYFYNSSNIKGFRIYRTDISGLSKSDTHIDDILSPFSIFSISYVYNAEGVLIEDVAENEFIFNSLGKLSFIASNPYFLEETMEHFSPYTPAIEEEEITVTIIDSGLKNFGKFLYSITIIDENNNESEKFFLTRLDGDEPNFPPLPSNPRSENDFGIMSSQFKEEISPLTSPSSWGALFKNTLYTRLKNIYNWKYFIISEEDWEAGGTGTGTGDSAYVYIAYASDDQGTGFTLTFNASLDYIAILTSDVEIPSPIVSDFIGLWKNYKGAQGIQGPAGSDGADGPTVFISDSTPDPGQGAEGDFWTTYIV